VIEQLLLVTDRKQAAAPLAEILGAAFAAGCRWASLREKDLSAEEQMNLARELLALARRFGARLTLHGDARLALAAGLDGVHLPAAADPAAARSLLGADALIGISIHSAAEARMLDRALVDYAVLGPVYATTSKPGYGPALGPEGVRLIARGAAVPIIAIGGITPDRVADVMRAGAAGVAVMGSVMRSADPAMEVRALLAALDPLNSPRYPASCW
jgi:thiamine-phosphate pyrophosphorylase